MSLICPIGSSGHRLILEIPALPVKAGSDVMLRCKRQNGVWVEAYFFMNGKRLRPEPQSEHKLSGVQLSDQGSYHCSTDLFGKSPESFLTVTGMDDDITSCLTNSR